MKYSLLAVIAFICNVGIAQQTLDRTITHGGLTREYRLYIPAAYNGNKAVPLVFNLHGYSSNNAQQELYTNFKPIADTANFIMCLPNGTYDTVNNRYWNVGFAASTIDDVGFISLLIDSLTSKYNIDSKKIFSTGMSNGGFLSYSLACQLSNKVAAIASVTGSMTIVQRNNCNPGRTVPVMQIHGTADATVPYAGTFTSLPIDTLIKDWVAQNGCSATPTKTNVPNTSLTDNSTAERFDYTNCAPGGEVVLYKAYSAGHTWPGAIINLSVTNMDFNASHEIWKFFLKHSLPNVSSIVDDFHELNTISIYPNPTSNFISIENSNNKKIASISIKDLAGKSYNNSWDASASTVNVQNIASGLYLCHIHFENGIVVVKKFLKN